MKKHIPILVMPNNLSLFRNWNEKTQLCLFFKNIRIKCYENFKFFDCYLFLKSLLICDFLECYYLLWLVDIQRFANLFSIDLIQRVWYLLAVFRILKISFLHSQSMKHSMDQHWALANISSEKKNGKH